MSKFSKPSTGTKTTNLAGGKAYSESPELEFVSILLTSFVQDQFYRSENKTISTLSALMNKIKDKKFLAQAAIYARTKFGMRSISHVTAGELSSMIRGEQWAKRFFDKIIYRTDDMTEILAYHLKKFGKPIPNAMKNGFASAFNRFDEYGLAKYRGEGHTVKLIDVVNLIRPRPTPKNKLALEKLVKGELRSTETWESKLTQAGQKAETKEQKEELKKDAWTDLIKNKKIKYFALLRNLRNILEQAPEMVDEAIELLTNENSIKKSLVLPFRFNTAVNELSKVTFDGRNKILIALSKATDISLSNVPKLPGKTLVALDSSASMTGKPVQIGSMFASVLYKSNDADYMTFSDKAKYQNFNPTDSIGSLTKQMNSKFIMSGTNFNSIFQTANRVYDRIVILSDMQGWIEDRYCWGYGGAPDKSFPAYKKKYDADPIVYSFDLQGYGTLQFPERNVYCLAGFSEKVFDVMKLLEQDRKALINEIKKIEL